mgnify:CR=1 FL=1
MKMKKLLSVLMVTAMTAGLLMGCGNTADNKAAGGTNSTADAGSSENTEGADLSTDTSEHVDLKMYLIGDRAADFDEVYDEVNKILEEKLNCSLTVDFLSWGEHDTKYSLLFSGNEDFDLIFTASSWCHYEQTAALGGFYPLSEEFISTYAPGVKEVLPEVAWNQAKIQGNIYMVPYNKKDYVSNALAIRGDMLEKLGMDTVGNWEDFKKFNYGCAENGVYGSQGNAYWQYFMGNGMYRLSGAPKSGELVLYNTQDPSDTNIYYALDWDKFATYCKDMKDMADAGCWSSDILNSTAERQDGLLNGTTASMVWNLGSCRLYGKQAEAEHPEWKMTMADPNVETPKIVNPYINGGMAINANSKNKERAMMVINELYCNRELQDLTMLGIEGKHWEAVGDDQYKILDASGFPTDNNCNWGWSNKEAIRTEYVENRTDMDDAYDTLLASFDENTKGEHPLDGFSFDTANVTTQVAAVEAACGNYYDPLMNGLVSDVDGTIEEFRAALDSAGMQDILDEIQRQVDEYLAAN